MKKGTPTVSVRAAAARDVANIAELEADVGSDWTAERVAAAVKAVRSASYVAYADGVCVGHALGVREPARIRLLRCWAETPDVYARLARRVAERVARGPERRAGVALPAGPERSDLYAGFLAADWTYQAADAAVDQGGREFRSEDRMVFMVSKPA